MDDLLGLLMSILFVAVIAIPMLGLVAISIGWRTRVDEETGEFVLRYSLPLRIFAVAVGFVIPLVLLVFGLFAPPQKPDDRLAAEILLTGFEILGWLLTEETFKRRVLVTPDGLVSHAPMRRARVMRWDEIVAVTSECPKAWFVFVGADRRRIEVPLYMAGLASLVAVMRRKLAPEVYAPAVAGFTLASRGAAEQQ